MADDALSKVEAIKAASRALRGTLREALSDPEAPLGEADATLLKFHGSYQQDDRDARKDRRAQGHGRLHSFMVRVAVPGGALTAEQYLALDALATRHGNGTLRLTTRQGVQFHGVLKGRLKPTIAAINEALLTTLAACGDVRRNVMACPAPAGGAVQREVAALAEAIARDLAPRTRAYHEIWLDGEKIAGAAEEEAEDPFYGPAYLPRKFKVAVAAPGDNCVDPWSQDVALVAVLDDGRVAGYDLLVGGGLGFTHNKPETYARLATPLGFVAPAQAVAAVRAVAAIFRDHGDRSDRRHARLKYLVEEWGHERFREAFTRYAGFAPDAPRGTARAPASDHLGAQPQGDGPASHYGVFVPSGRVSDGEGARLRSGLAAAVRRFGRPLRLTPMQSVLFVDLAPGEAEALEELLLGYGVVPPARLAPARRFMLACPALPTCGLALAEAERALPALVEALEVELAALGAGDAPLTVRMTGCPNGCARPYTADIAFVGRRTGVYHVYVGGSLAGDRLADLYAADVPVASLVAALRPLLADYAAARAPGEGLGDYWQRRAGPREPRRILTGRELPAAVPPEALTRESASRP